MVTDRYGLTLVLALLHPADHLFQAIGSPAQPSLLPALLNSGIIYFGDHPCAAGNLDRLGLGPAHPPQSGAYEVMSGQVLHLGDAQEKAPGVQEG